MAKIHISTIPSWIINKMAHRVKDNHTTDHEVTISSETDHVPGAVTVYMDILGRYQHQKELYSNDTHVGLFTHRDDWQNNFTNMDEWLKHHDHRVGWSKLDGIMVLCQRYNDVVRGYGYQGDVETIITSNASQDFNLSPVRLLVCQRGESAHYGKAFLLELVSKHTDLMQHFEFVFVGYGWRDAVEYLKNYGVAAKHFKMEEDLHAIENDVHYPRIYQNWYDWCDYLFIPILETGGPLSMLEAACCGKSIISSDVGFANYEVHNGIITYSAGDIKDCTMKLWALINERRCRARQIMLLNLSWENYANNVINFAVRVHKERLAS